MFEEDGTIVEGPWCGGGRAEEADEALLGDLRLAAEIARFVAERAQLFNDHECRAWALTDFGVWAVLAGRSPLLALGPALPPDDAGETSP